MKDLLKGSLVHLAAVDPEEVSKQFSSWNRDSEFKRLLDSCPSSLHSAKATKDWLDKELGEQADTLYWFTIRAAADNQLLGDIVLDVTQWNARDAFVGIGIGPRDFWGRGYGTEAMQLILQYAFLELNLNRVTLNVFEYNQRGVRSYEKAGFRHEGRQRGSLLREGKRWDMLYMGILKEDWSKQHDHPQPK
ncbi:MAG: GNAT family N-acetyltransferase [Chloroflexota bacterium]